MRYRIRHLTQYTYSKPVSLQPHVLRLRPRSDGAQSLQTFELQVDPQPLNVVPLVDLEGNTTLSVWFDSAMPTPHLKIETLSEVETYRTNPFDYLTEPWALRWPIDYPQSLAAMLHPYLSHPLYPMGEAGVAALAQSTLHQVEGHIGYFLTALTDRIYQTCEYSVRYTGDPLPAGLTWQHKQGSCRDFVVLFIEACRAVGLAARFVSGYEEGDPDTPERELHAWAEVYVPGGGWRGFDPTHGLAVADRHIAVAAAAHPRQAAPVTGQVQQADIQSTLVTQIDLQAL